LGTEINWKKSASIWQNNIISGGKSFSNKGPLNKAAEAVKAAIGKTPAPSGDDSSAMADALHVVEVAIGAGLPFPSEHLAGGHDG